MADNECVAFLQWALPRIGRRWAGFRNVRGQACKRVRRRVAELGLAGLTEYRRRLEADPAEWGVLETLCIVTISRFYRDARVWNALRDRVLPELAREAPGGVLRCWSAGCASGEEPYTLSMLWRLELAPRFPDVTLRVLATELDAEVLRRAREGVYEAGSLRELPAGWRERAFEPHGEEHWAVVPAFREGVEFRQADLQRALPDEAFQLILCRNVVLTYFDEPLQRSVLEQMLATLSGGGAFVAAPRERVPSGLPLAPWSDEAPGIYRLTPSAP